jgi:Plant transposon protein
MHTYWKNCPLAWQQSISLDCMHTTYWKNCPVAAWQQSFKGKSGGPTIVFEAVADHCLWFWHASYGYSGAMNDLNILNQSPLVRKMTDGSFSAIKREARVVPFSIIGEQFDKLFMLVGGIYP